MNTLRPVRLKIAWGDWSKGHVFTAMSAGQAEVMVRDGKAEYVTGIIAASPVTRVVKKVGYAIGRIVQT